MSFYGKIHIHQIMEVQNVYCVHNFLDQKLDHRNAFNVQLDIIHQAKDKDVYNVIVDPIQMK